MQKLRYILVWAVGLLLLSCSRTLEEEDRLTALPDGTPIWLNLSFGTRDPLDVDISTKAEATTVDEARVHDLYVFIFDAEGNKIYGRYFNYEHLTATLEELDSDTHEGWYVENKSLESLENPVTETTGAVKIATRSCSDATLAVLANVDNAVMAFVGEDDEIAYLNAIQTLDELRASEVHLEQDIVNRKDLFLKLGTLEHVNLADMVWGTLPQNYNTDYQVTLSSLDAKVKFLVRCNDTHISAEKAVYWEVYNAPDRCYLFPDYKAGEAPDDVMYFDTEESYFEGTTVVDNEQWYVFSFYMLESCLAARQNATEYYDREKQEKNDSGESGYHGGGNYVENGEWIYADPHAPYVQFDLILTLTPEGIYNATGSSINNALTSDAVFTVHLGDFTGAGIDDYNTLRGHAYTYKILVNNSGSIYAEVEHDQENQAAQEGFLILTDNEIVNADCHYVSHSISFTYNSTITADMFSWYVKTPFGEGQPEKYTDPDDADAILYNPEGLDYLWVKYAVNALEGDVYSDNRVSYPGDSAYDPSWKPSLTDANGDPVATPELMDVSQLIEYIFDQNRKKKAGESNDFDTNSQIKVTAFIDEYYYETNPLTGKGSEDLWRSFVNAKPREMHILSNARTSRDQRSDVINSSHSIVQESIQTIYNIYAPGLRNIWGCEHRDEIKEKVPDGWVYWPLEKYGSTTECPLGERYGTKWTDTGKSNGRLNTGYMWRVYSSNAAGGNTLTDQQWATFMNFNVDNDTPELREAYQGMAFSCMTRNRDNNGNGVIDPEEVRWYLAASQQLLGMMLGNESLSLEARLYQPADGQWRAHVMSSTEIELMWTEEGGAMGAYSHDAITAAPYHCWSSYAEAAKGQTVRCLRNIGTYDEDGVVTDVTYAPYDLDIDKYYTLEEDGEGHYTFHLDRLDAKSLRDYSAGELPYHEQTSLTNRLYLQFTTQSKAEEVEAYSVKMKDQNPEVTALGYNPYCPEGYRFPNYDEMMLMTMALPATYLTQDAEGTAYASNVMFPTRTYYDKGYYGSLRSDTEPWSVEQDKVGWTATTSVGVYCQESNHFVNHSRCVRDDNMTGYINGEVTVPDNCLCPDDWSDIHFNFFSTASALSYASVKLCYTAHSGNYREIDIPVENSPSGIQYRQTQQITVPSLAAMGLEFSDLPVDLTLETTVRNVAGISKTVSLPLQLVHPLQEVSIDLPQSWSESEGLPVEVSYAMVGHTSTVTSAILQWKALDGDWVSYDLTDQITDPTSRSFTEVLYNQALTGFPDLTADGYTGVGKYYRYRFYVETDDGVGLYSGTKSMELLHYCFDPNPAPEGGWTSANQVSEISTTWQDTVTDLAFSSGDQIEVLMDLEHCNYVYKNGTNDGDIGLDNLFGIGLSKIDGSSNAANSILWYYPAVETMSDTDPGESRLLIHCGAWTNGKYPLSDLSSLLIVFDQNGYAMNGTRYDNLAVGNWTALKSSFASATSLVMGSVEGKHHSRAFYPFIRIVREE